MPIASSRWAATTRRARPCRSGSARSSSRVSGHALSSSSAPTLSESGSRGRAPSRPSSASGRCRSGSRRTERRRPSSPADRTARARAHRAFRGRHSARRAWRPGRRSGKVPEPLPAETLRVGYVLKRYPALLGDVHRQRDPGARAGRPRSRDLCPGPPGRGGDCRARPRRARSGHLPGPARGRSAHLGQRTLTAHELWLALRRPQSLRPQVWARLADARPERARHVYQALLLAREAMARGVSHLHAHFATAATAVARLAARLRRSALQLHLPRQGHLPRERPARRNCTQAAGRRGAGDGERLQPRLSAAAPGSGARSPERVYNGLDSREFSYRSPANTRRGSSRSAGWSRRRASPISSRPARSSPARAGLRVPDRRRRRARGRAARAHRRPRPRGPRGAARGAAAPRDAG